jgi:hypothetical protein
MSFPDSGVRLVVDAVGLMELPWGYVSVNAGSSIDRSGSTSPLVSEGESELVEIPLMLLPRGRLFA